MASNPLQSTAITPVDLATYSAGAVGAFQFSGARPDSLTAVEYTLATIVIDITGSVDRFSKQLLQALKTAIEACRKAPRADNLLVRVTTFNSYVGVQEVHGFIPLQQIDPANYKDFNPNGMTNLFDAVYEAVEATNRYAKVLTEQDFQVNACIYIVTDGDNNASTRTTTQIKDAIARVKTDEVMESLHAALIGINDASFKNVLENFAMAIGLNQYVSVDDATPGKLARLAQFVSKSISSQSQALGTGGPSQNLTF